MFWECLYLCLIRVLNGKPGVYYCGQFGTGFLGGELGSRRSLAAELPGPGWRPCPGSPPGQWAWVVMNRAAMNILACVPMFSFLLGEHLAEGWPGLREV